MEYPYKYKNDGNLLIINATNPWRARSILKDVIKDSKSKSSDWKLEKK